MRTRNARLAALRAFLKFAGHRDVDAPLVVEQALGGPMKRFERPMLGFLSREEMLAIIGKPGSSWTSQRDHLLLHMLYNTGARVLEITGVRLADVVLDGAACVHLHGKGRKQRTMPLWRSTVKAVRSAKAPRPWRRSTSTWRRWALPPELHFCRENRQKLSMSMKPCDHVPASSHPRHVEGLRRVSGHGRGWPPLSLPGWRLIEPPASF
ncbi:tyrosine-type recombinase/integrase [Piscinibacter sp.]|uniref:tyrosine-type recombinase/integrase n=1 Tax=Piscinibacter sp. TaxID=1903157 RepID=UPI002F3E8647